VGVIALDKQGAARQKPNRRAYCHLVVKTVSGWFGLALALTFPRSGSEASLLSTSTDNMPGISANSERLRALQLLARCPTGCTETLMLAHGFSAEMLGRLVIDGLVTTQPGTMLAGRSDHGA
jgi:hypothetical protein